MGPKRTLKLTISVDVDDDVWGWSEVVDECDEMGDSESERNIAVIELFKEDLTALLDFADWQIELGYE